MTDKLKVGEFVLVELDALKAKVGRIIAIGKYIHVDFSPWDYFFLPSEIRKIQLIGPHHDNRV